MNDPTEITLLEPSHVGYVTENIEKSMADFQRYFGLGPFTEMIPEYFNKEYHGKPEDFKVRLAFSKGILTKTRRNIICVSN